MTLQLREPFDKLGELCARHDLEPAEVEVFASWLHRVGGPSPDEMIRDLYAYLIANGYIPSEELYGHPAVMQFQEEGNGVPADPEPEPEPEEEADDEDDEFEPEDDDPDPIDEEDDDDEDEDDDLYLSPDDPLDEDDDEDEPESDDEEEDDEDDEDELPELPPPGARKIRKRKG